MRSAIYEGELVHQRTDPAHRFSMRIAMPLLDLDEIHEVVARHPLWSVDRPNAVSFRRVDYLGEPEVPLPTAVRDTVEQATGRRPVGPISVLAHVRTWGWLFNPIAVYYCFAPDGHEVEHAVAHVTNTPWKERHAYVLGGPGAHDVDKQLHVSPFFGMEQWYRISYQAPDDHLRVGIALHEQDDAVFHASLHLERREINRRSLSRVLWRYPMLTPRVSLGIHTHALRLWRKGATYHPHPSKKTPEVTSAGPDHRPDRPEQAA